MSNESYEWTMTRYGLDSSRYRAWRVILVGYVSWDSLLTTYAVRPVFYLKSDAKLTTNGESSYAKGSIDNPWIVEMQ